MVIATLNILMMTVIKEQENLNTKAAPATLIIRVHRLLYFPLEILCQD